MSSELSLASESMVLRLRGRSSMPLVERSEPSTALT
jgi:hypothetical protein